MFFIVPKVASSHARADFRYHIGMSNNKDNPSHKLAAYGTLRPGESNYHIVSEINGTWVDGTVTGVLSMQGQYPAFTWTADGPSVAVKVLISAELPNHWQRIDAFEGSQYVRQIVPVEVNGETWMCNIYEGRPTSSGA
jgi:gamma-glutamylcyclotransferase (GGCT)/AIG2-like uncharacterized protein YtfP